MKCMVITSQMYSHYKSSYIQFLTLGGSYDHLYKPSKFPFLASHMTCLYKQSPFFAFLVIFQKMLPKNAYVSHQKFPFLVSHMTCLHNPSKFPFLEIPSQTISCGCLHKPSKFPFLIFLYMVSHMIITTHLVPPYPWFLPNQETLLNQVTGSSPPTE